MGSLIEVQTRGWMRGLHTSRCRDFAFHHQIQADCRSNPTSYPMYTEVSLPLHNTTQAYTLTCVQSCFIAMWWCLYIPCTIHLVT